jgi:Spy/CpxP family protein refolding chaperone
LKSHLQVERSFKPIPYFNVISLFPDFKLKHNVVYYGGMMMKNHTRIFGVVLAAALFGVAANLAVAEPSSDWQNNMGPGMMGGYGPGMGPGMMGGYGPGYGGMMGGYGPGYGMGPGMMGWGNYRDLNLSDDQKSKIGQIRKDMRAKQWPLMGEMMDARDKLQDLYDSDKQDAAAIDKQYKVVEDLRRQMVDNAVDTHNRINSILTKEQREKSREGGRGYGPMMRGWGY